MRRVFLAFTATMLICQISMGGESAEYLLWQEYEMKSGEWIYQLVRRSPFVKSGLVRPKEMVAKILSKNPHIADPNLVKPGMKLLMPIVALPESSVSSDGRTVNYHFYINSQIFNGGAVPGQVYQGPPRIQPAKTNQATDRTVASGASAPVNSVKTQSDSGGDWSFESGMGVGFYYSFIKSTDLSSGSEAARASKLNQSLDLNLASEVWEEFLFETQFVVGNESYTIGSLQTLDFTAGLWWNYESTWLVGLGAGYTQVPVVTSDSGTLVLENIGLPKLSPNVRFVTKLPWQVNLQLGITYDYLMSGAKDQVEVKSGSGFRVDIRGKKEVFGYDLALQTWLSSKSIQTNITEQAVTGAGLGLSWAGTF